MDGANKSCCNKSDKLYNKAVRIIDYRNGKRVYMDIDALFRKYNVAHLNVRRKQQLLGLIYYK